MMTSVAKPKCPNACLVNLSTSAFQPSCDVFVQQWCSSVVYNVDSGVVVWFIIRDGQKYIKMYFDTKYKIPLK